MIYSAIFFTGYYFALGSVVEGFEKACKEDNAVSIVKHTLGLLILAVAGIIGFLASLVLADKGIWL